MKLAIISDIHDNLANLNIFFEMISQENIEKIICCGDLSNNETLKVLSKKFHKEIFLVYGNAEIYTEEEVNNYSNITYLGKLGIISVDNINIGVCHEPMFIKKLLQKQDNLQYIFYGHTHKPWTSVRQSAKLINPGTLGGVFQKASFAILNTEDLKIKLKLIHYDIN